MKNRIIIVLLLIIIPWYATGKTTRVIHLSFSKEDFSFDTNNGETSISTNKYPTAFSGDTQSPALPLIGLNVLIGAGEQVCEVNVTGNETLLMEDVYIPRNPKYIPTNSTVQNTIKPETDYTGRFYPAKQIEIGGTRTIDGYRILSLALCPFKYDATDKVLYLKDHIDVEINLSVTERVTKISNRTSSPGTVMRDMVKDIIVNKDDLRSLYPMNDNTEVTYNLSRSSSNDYDYDYVIVTSQNLKPAFQRLADWKTKKGIRTKVLTVEDIDNTYSGNRQQLRIKQALKEYKDNNANFRYALLGGDTDVVPAQMSFIAFYLLDLFVMQNNCDTTPCDLFYSCFDTMDWDTNNNGVYGEVADSVDLDPEIYIGRIPVSTYAQAEGIVDRIIKYEQGSFSSWNGKMLLAGNKLFRNYVVDGVTMSDAQHKSEWSFNSFINPYWNGSCDRLYDTYTDFYGHENYDFSPDHLKTQLEKGYVFADITTHGNTDCFLLENNTLFTSNNASQVQNIGNTVITTVACHTNAFDSASDCLSESFFKNANSGVLGYYGGSRYGLSIDSIGERGPSFWFNEDFYKYLVVNSDNNMGRAVVMSKSEHLFCSNWEILPYRWLLLSNNLLGDPEMPVFLKRPKTFDNISYSFTNGSLSINTGQDSCRICIMSLNDSGQSYYQVLNNVNNASLSGLTGSYYLCITRRGFAPFIAICSEDMYLQNETITDNTVILSRRTYGGSDVTNTKPQGAVVIQNGKTAIHSNEYTIISNDFEVQLGGELYIGN